MTTLQAVDMGRAKAADAPLATGRLLTYADVGGGLKGRQAEVSCTISLCSCMAALMRRMAL